MIDLALFASANDARTLRAAASRLSAGDIHELFTLWKADPDLGPKASWIILHIAKSSPGCIKAEDLSAIIGLAGRASDWSTKLHIAQLFDIACLLPRQRQQARKLVRDWAQDPKPFVRAWSLNALAKFARTRDERDEAVALALGDSAASVRARGKAMAKLPKTYDAE